MYLGSKPSEDRRLLTGSLDLGEQINREMCCAIYKLNGPIF